MSAANVWAMYWPFISPELALVDPELRMQAIADLPEFALFDFARSRDQPRPHSGLDESSFLADYSEAERFKWQPSLPLAAAIYLLAAFTRLLVVAGIFYLAVAAAVLLLIALP